jgi:hypothetical protein
MPQLRGNETILGLNIEKTCLGTCGKNFSDLFTISLEIHSVEDRIFD